MSREILFRGKRIDNGEWMEGYVSKYFDGFKTATCIAWPTRETITGSLCYDVDPATVGQYTGLTDKNGKKIFEGDIVLLTYKSEEGTDTERVEVRYHTTWLKWVITNEKDEPGYYFEDFGECDTSEIEVIGNIHDNPELLEGE